ncbi:MAG: hypothetical protein OEW02_09410, partial [Myxococcales bacterium]|nr:hypothetical protein [Myxococcales bacterium]
MRRTCYFHAGCPDGFGAAWAVWRSWGDEARYVPRSHGDPFDPTIHEDTEVVFVDIALRNDQLRALGEVADRLVVLDHHVSALDHYKSDLAVENLLARAGHTIHFDLSH